MVDVKKFTNIDLYGLLGIEIGATENEVNKLSFKPNSNSTTEKIPFDSI